MVKEALIVSADWRQAYLSVRSLVGLNRYEDRRRDGRTFAQLNERLAGTLRAGEMVRKCGYCTGTIATCLLVVAAVRVAPAVDLRKMKIKL